MVNSIMFFHLIKCFFFPHHATTMNVWIKTILCEWNFELLNRNYYVCVAIVSFRDQKKKQGS
jgi:hypothetical protein